MKWPMVEIKKIAEVASGFGFPRKYQGCLNEEFPFFKVGDMNLPGNEKMMVVATNTISVETLKKLRAKPFPRGTVIFPKIGAAIATNKKRMLLQPSVVDNNVMGLIPNQHIDPWYLFYWTQQFDLRTVSNIGPVPSIRKSEVQRVRVPLPPLSEQRRIVEILDQADALRKKRVEADAKAARILSALFYKIFGDPATNPKGWPVKTLGELSIRRPQYGANAKAIDYQEGMPRYVRITDITDDGRLSNADIRSLDMENWDAYRLVEGDLLFARSGATVGKTYLYQPEDGLCAYAGYLIRFQLDRSAIDPWVVFAFTQTPHYQSWVASKRRAAAQPNINGQEYASLPIPRPDRESQEKFVNAIQDLRRLHMKREQSARQIENLFLVLLHRAFTGDLTAQWREAHMKELLSEMEQQAKALECKSDPKVSKRTTTRHAGHDMYNKAALAAFITERCHHPDHPLGRVKLAKIFYLVQKKAELELTESFAKRAAGPLDDDIHKFLNLARKNKWVVLGRAKGDLKPVRPGQNVKEAVEQISKRLGEALPQITEMIEQMKGWGWKALERWATVLHAAEELAAKGTDPTVQSVKDALEAHPVWKDKLNRQEFSDSKLAATLKGLRSFGFIPEQT